VSAAIYARVSSEVQKPRGTIGSQVEALRHHVSALGHEVVSEFLDQGYSGARLDRPGLDALRDAAEAGGFEELWCLTPDRLARSHADHIFVLDELARCGVQVRFLDAPPIADDPQAKLLVQVQGVIAEYERYAEFGITNAPRSLSATDAASCFVRVPARSSTGASRTAIAESRAAQADHRTSRFTSRRRWLYVASSTTTCPTVVRSERLSDVCIRQVCQRGRAMRCGPPQRCRVCCATRHT